jgi:hypothetical protein
LPFELLFWLLFVFWLCWVSELSEASSSIVESESVSFSVSLTSTTFFG